MRQGFVGKVGVETVEALDHSPSGGVVGDGLVEDQRVMLANVIVGESLLVGVVEALEAREWNMLLVLGPRDFLGLEQVHNSSNVGRGLVKIVVVHTEGVTTSGGAIVWLRRVSGRKVVGQGDSLGCLSLDGHTEPGSARLTGKEILVWVTSGGGVIDVLHPDLVESLESNTLDIAHWGQAEGSGSGLCDLRRSRLNGRDRRRR